MSSRTWKKKRLPKNVFEHDLKPSTLPVLIIVESKKVFYEQSRRLVGLSGSASTFGKNGIIVRKAPIDASIQKVFSTLLEARLLQQAHQVKLAGHLEERRMNE